MSSQFTGQTIRNCLIKSQIGEGGGGMVFLGSHPSYGERIVIKILPAEALQDQQSRLRFEREIQMSVELSHPNIVKVFEASADSDYYYIMMEFIDGMDIEQWVEERGCINHGDAADIVIQIAKALEFAHSKQIIHRDVKPSNILVNKNRQAKLCDFGLAKDLKTVSELTCTGMVLGTPNFMSPEQWFGAKDLTAQSDIYSLGATFYYMITGSRPFEGDDSAAVMSNSLFGETPSPKKILPDLPDGICRVIEKMLAREIESRYKTITEVIEHLTGQPKTDRRGFLGRLFGGG